jgi:hypothetical protein
MEMACFVAAFFSLAWLLINDFFWIAMVSLLGAPQRFELWDLFRIPTLCLLAHLMPNYMYRLPLNITPDFSLC